MTQSEPLAGNAGAKATRLGQWSYRVTLAAVAIAALGLTLARYDLIPKLSGFSALLAGGVLALIALLLALWAIFAGRGTSFPTRTKALAALVVSVVYVGFLGSRPLAAGEVPAIHDVTTDLAAPPQFATLPLRPDNLAGVETVENWQRIHRQAYGDLRSVIIQKPVPTVTAEAARLAEAMGWDIVRVDPARGHIEATASVSYIRFKDDVVIRVVPSADGTGSRVDLRSVSRVGVSDFGVNAKRIRAFLKQLAGS